jgi:hypothetical protein
VTTLRQTFHIVNGSTATFHDACMLMDGGNYDSGWYPDRSELVLDSASATIAIDEEKLSAGSTSKPWAGMKATFLDDVARRNGQRTGEKRVACGGCLHAGMPGDSSGTRAAAWDPYDPA